MLTCLVSRRSCSSPLQDLDWRFAEADANMRKAMAAESSVDEAPESGAAAPTKPASA